MTKHKRHIRYRFPGAHSPKEVTLYYTPKELFLDRSLTLGDLIGEVELSQEALTDSTRLLAEVESSLPLLKPLKELL